MNYDILSSLSFGSFINKSVVKHYTVTVVIFHNYEFQLNCFKLKKQFLWVTYVFK